MSTPLVKYVLERDTLVVGNLIRKGSSVYLAADVDDLLRQREAELDQCKLIAMRCETGLLEKNLEIDYLRSQLAATLARCAQYDELIMAVASKYPGETRHDTAKRYIQERESRPCSGPAQATPTERTPA